MQFKYGVFLIFFSLGFLHAQTWQEIDINSQNLGGFTDLAQHKGKLFGTSYLQGLVYSTDGGNSFTTMTTDTLAGTWSRMFSAGNRLYVNTWIALQLDGKVWYSEDEGVTWQIDTAGGLPSAIIAHYTVMDNDHILAQWQGDDQYYRRDPVDAAWTRMDTFYKNSNDPYIFDASNDTLLACTPLEVQYSSDNGATWTFLPDQGLPFYMGVTGFDMANGRIYIVDKQFNEKPVLWYSDDFGTNWDSLSIGGFFDKNAFGTDQTSYFLKAIGDDVWISLENDASNSVIDIIHSTDRGATWQYDTAGLHVDPFGTDAIRSMFEFNGELYAVCALGKAYKKTFSIGKEELSFTDKMKVYPNPARDIITIDLTGELIKSVSLLDMQGNVVQSFSGIYASETEMPLKGIARGAYILEVETFDGILTERILLE